MYRGRLWTMRQYAGMGDAEESNKRYKYLLANGTTGLSVAFDLPTQIGLDSDHPLAVGEVGKVGVAIDSIEDMQRLFDGIDLTKISTSMTINATASILLALYVAVARRQGADIRQAVGHRAERRAQGIHRSRHLHLSAGAGHAHHHRPVCLDQPERSRVEHDFDLRLSHARSRIDRGSGSRVHAGQWHRLRAGAPSTPASTSTSLLRGFPSSSTPTTTFWKRWPSSAPPAACGPRIMREHFEAKNPRSWMLRFHTQTAGSTLTAQQPENNIVRTALQALAAVLGGTQSLHTNSYDEALALPTEQAARIALRTQQIMAYESGVPQTVDPLAGSYYIEALTNEIETRASEYLGKIEALGGMIKAIERGYVQQEIQNAAYEYQQQVDREEAVVVGVNRFAVDEEKPIPIQRIDEALERKQVERLRALRARRDPEPVASRSPANRRRRPLRRKSHAANIWPQSKPTQPSARSRTPCEKCSGSTKKRWLSSGSSVATASALSRSVSPSTMSASRVRAGRPPTAAGTAALSGQTVIRPSPKLCSRTPAGKAGNSKDRRCTSGCQLAPGRSNSTSRNRTCLRSCRTACSGTCFWWWWPWANSSAGSGKWKVPLVTTISRLPIGPPAAQLKPPPSAC